MRNTKNTVNQKMRKTFTVATTHSDYQIEQFNDLRYHNTNDGFCCASLIYNPSGFNYEQEIDPDLCFSTDDKKYYGNVEIYTRDHVIYKITGDEKGFERFVSKLVKMMIDRITWVEIEDHHTDFYWSTLDLVGQIAQRSDQSRQLKALQEAIEEYTTSQVYCVHCGDNCDLVDVLSPYLS